MGQTVPLWIQRTDVVAGASLPLFSDVMDAANVDSFTLFINVGAIDAGAVVTLQMQHGLDPNIMTDVGSSVAASGNGNTAGIVGGQASGSTVAVGPLVRVKASISGTAGKVITWSASVTAR